MSLALVLGVNIANAQMGQMPSHRHGIGRTSKNKEDGGSEDFGRGTTMTGRITTSTGSDAAHNNMQPYTRVFVWRRIEEVAEE